MIISGKLEYSKDCVINSHIDLADLDMLKKKTDPRILHTHLPYSYLPAKHKENRYKIVFMLRNPKDREVSWFHFSLGKSKRTPVDLPWSVYFEQIVMSNAGKHKVHCLYDLNIFNFSYLPTLGSEHSILTFNLAK